MSFIQFITQKIIFPITRKLTLLFILSLPSTITPAQEVSLFFDHYSIAEGLSDNHVLCFEQDKNGFLWIGTNSGLNRFDGERFEKYYSNPDDSLSLPGNMITALLIDSRDQLWVGTYGDGVALRDATTGKYKRYRLPSAGYSERSSNKVEGLYWFDNTILVSCFSGAFYYDKESDKFRTINDGFVTHPDIDFGLQLLLTPDTINHGMWFRSYDDYYFMNELGHEVYGSNNNPKEWIVFDEYIRSTPTVDKKGNLWFQNWNDELLKCFSPSSNTITAADIPEIRKGEERYYSSIARILCDRENTLWFVRNNPVQLRYTPDRGIDSSLFAFDYPGAIGKGTVNSLFQDKSGATLVGTSHGFYYEQQPIFTTHLFFSGVDEQIQWVKAIDDRLVIITNLSIIEVNTQHPEEKHRVRLSEIGVRQAVVFTSSFDDDHILLQTIDNEFRLLNVHTFKSEPITFSFEESTDEMSSQSLGVFEVRGDFLWTSIFPFGLFRENIRTGEVLHWSPSQEGNFQIPAGHVNSISIRDNGEVLVALGGGKGIYQLNPSTSAFEPYLVPGVVISDMQLPDVNVLSMYCDVSGTVFASLEGKGLYAYDGKKLTRYDRLNGLPSESIYKIIKANDRSLALFTSTGLYSFDTQLKTFTLVNAQVSNNNTFVHEGGITQGIGGNVLYFHKNVVYSIAFGQPVIDNKTFKPSISSIRIFDVPLFADKVPSTIVLNYDQNFFTLSLSSFDFHLSNSTELSYKLEGFDKEWNDCTYTMDAPYTNVPGGSYTFMVRSRASGEEWQTPVTYSIIVHPPFWETWWFRLLIAFLLISIVYGIYRYRLSQIIKLQAVRNKIASDLHDDIGATLSSINIFSKVAGDNLHSRPDETGQLLDRIHTSTTKMMDNMSDIVWSINPQNDTLHSLALRIRAHAAEVLGIMGIQVNLHNELKEDIQLNMNARKNIYLVAKESINNIAKHSGATEASLSFTAEKGLLCLEISDNGKGSTTNSGKGGNGLKNMERRAGELGGKCEFISDMKNGTTVRFQLPMTNIHH